MALTDQRYTVRFSLPDLIVRGVSHTLYAPIYLDGALVAPTAAAAVSVYDPSGTVKVDAETATITASIAEYTIAAGDLSSESLAAGWRVEWSLPISGGPTLTPRNDAALVRNGLWPVISDVDIVRRMPSLDPSSSSAITSATNYQGELDEAWTMINSRLIRLGNRPNLIMEPSSLRDAHMALTLALIFEGRLASRLDLAYGEAVDAYYRQYEAAWSALNPRYDSDDDGQADASRRPAQPTIWLNGGRRRWAN